MKRVIVIELAYGGLSAAIRLQNPDMRWNLRKESI